MEQNPSWETDSHWASQEVACILWNLKLNSVCHPTMPLCGKVTPYRHMYFVMQIYLYDLVGYQHYGGSKFLWNLGILLQHCTASQPRRPQLKCSPLWKPQIMHLLCLNAVFCLWRHNQSDCSHNGILTCMFGPGLLRMWHAFFFAMKMAALLTDSVLMCLQIVSEVGTTLTCSKLFQFKRISEWNSGISSLTEPLSC
jgi:hypothetical protein